MIDYTNKLLVIIGPTASGKSAWALRLAKKYRGAIISADSRQIYKGLSIGTNAPSLSDRQGIPHYFIQTISPRTVYSVSRFQREATRTIKLCWKKGYLPIVVGGTGLYVSSIIQGFSFSGRQPTPAVRRSLNALTLRQLFIKLQRLAPKTSRTIDRHNRHRLIRAIEIAAQTGQEPLVLRNFNAPLWDILQLGIDVDRNILYRSINQRVDSMIRRGLIAETKRVSKKYSWKAPALSGIGYKQIGQFLRGDISKDEAIRLIKRDTRHYAKRQLTWFRRDRNIRWRSNFAQAEKAVRAFLRK